MRPQVPEGYRVGYRHDRDYVGERSGRPVHGRTIAFLKYMNENGDISIVAEGYAFCGAGEQYNRRIGRDIALGRALKELSAKSVA